MTWTRDERPDERHGLRGTLRAGDDDRTRVASLLAEHYAQGRLDLAEFDERSSRALMAVRLAELDLLLADLPGPHAVRPPVVAPLGPSPARAAPRGLWRALPLLLAVALVVMTRGAAIWLLLPLLWWVSRPARFSGRRGPRTGTAYLTAPAAWRTSPACQRWSVPRI